MILLLTIVYLTIPVLILVAAEKNSFIEKIGPAILCYAAGIAMSALGVFSGKEHALEQSLMALTVPLAIPLMLFNIDIKRWLRLAGKTMLSLLFVIISVLIASFVGYLLFKNSIAESWKVSGMLVGVYTGGSTNLSAIGLALQVDSNVLVLSNTADMLVSLPWFLLMLSFGQKLLCKFLPSFPAKEKQASTEEMANFSSYRGIFAIDNLLPLARAFLVALACCAIGIALYCVLPKNLAMPISMLAITTFSIACSFIPSLRKTKMTFQLGQYLVLVFCVAVGTLADLKMLLTATPAMIGYTCIVVYGAWLIHLLLSFVAKIDADTTIITSVSAIFSPPFVPVVAASLKNREIVASGITTGIIGYALGNYLGIAFAYLLKGL